MSISNISYTEFYTN